MRETAYVKPLISLNSFVILPPWSVTAFFALLFISKNLASKHPAAIPVQLGGVCAWLQGDLQMAVSPSSWQRSVCRTLIEDILDMNLDYVLAVSVRFL